MQELATKKNVLKTIRKNIEQNKFKRSRVQ